MKATGMVRKIDSLGRIVLPKELRHTLVLPEETPIEIFVDGSTIILKKYEPGCIFCGTVTNKQFKDKNVCDTCQQNIKGGA